jgi:phenylalanyl-tRNA synthetase beta chain
MKITEQELRCWVEIDEDLSAIAGKLTSVGLESMVDGDQLDIELTPNRGDCASVLGVARVCAILYGQALPAPRFASFPTLEPSDSVLRLEKDKDIDVLVPFYRACVLSLDTALDAQSLAALLSCLDKMMLTFGIPLFAYDREALSGNIISFKKDKAIELWDGTGRLGVAALKLERAACSVGTQKIVLESAWWLPEAMMGQAHTLNLISEAAYRYERGIDPCLIEGVLAESIERLQALLGPLRLEQQLTWGLKPEAFPRSIILPLEKVSRYLGRDLEASFIKKHLEAIGCLVSAYQEGKILEVQIPSYRHDIMKDIQLIMEIADGIGLDKIPAVQPLLSLSKISDLSMQTSNRRRRFKEKLISSGFQEVIHYSFVHPLWEKALSTIAPLALDNPMSVEKSVMRTTLWGGLLERLSFLQARQQKRLRLFETGRCFLGDREEERWACVMAGRAQPESWQFSRADNNGFDCKGLIQRLFPQRASGLEYLCVEGVYPALAYAIEVRDRQELLCSFGPLAQSHYDLFSLQGSIWLMEGKMSFITEKAHEILVIDLPSKFPKVRRDLSLILPKEKSVLSCLRIIEEEGSSLLVDHCVFDRYTAKNGEESIGVALFFQSKEVTLHDLEVEKSLQAIILALEKKGITLRAI